MKYLWYFLSKKNHKMPVNNYRYWISIIGDDIIPPKDSESVQGKLRKKSKSINIIKDMLMIVLVTYR